ncbi:glycosyl transferase, partial [Francisella tularensis subsp. holarctica]|nr:glycosyl transferase [Francisella tularensis subsp. holarctica]
MLSKLCKSMDKSIYHITFISLMGRGVFANKLEAYGFKVYTLNLNKFNVIFVLLKYIKIIIRIKPDVINSWM